MRQINSIDNRIEKVLISSKEIKIAITQLAKKINAQYRGKSPIVLGVLKGCLPFYNELFLQLTCDPVMDFMVVSSYRGVKSTGTPKIITDLRQNIEGRHVIVVEDIIDTGYTMKNLVDILHLRKPKSIKVLTLTDKPKCRKVIFKPDYACFKVDPVFVVGFGLDYNEKFRNLPYIGILKKSVYERGEK